MNGSPPCLEATLPRHADELDVLEALLPLRGARLVELGCGAAQLARALLERFADADVTALEVDARQLAKNAAEPHERLHFVRAGAQAIPFGAERFDGALMLKSLHHVPVPLMGAALDEAARVLVPGGWLYVSEPIYGGALNELMRLFHDEREVRAAAQQAIDAAIARGILLEQTQRRFTVPRSFRDFADFERRMMHPTFAEHRIDAALREAVRARFEPHADGSGAHFRQPMHVRVLRSPRGARHAAGAG